MAKIVTLISAPHDPTLPISKRLNAIGKADPGSIKALEYFDELQNILTTSKPDILVSIGSDHFGQWFMNNMPQFMIGKATRMQGPMPDEISAWGLEQVDLPIQGELARQILKQGLNKGVDFSYSDEFTADHSFTIPLNFLRPENDLPVVPIFINLLAPPVPPGWRYAQVGAVIRQTIEQWDSDLRVAVIATGHMTNAVGSPHMLDILTEPETEWDTKMWSLMTDPSKLDEITALSTWDQLYEHGNGTPGFLGNVLALGFAGGAQSTFAKMVATTAQPAVCFMAWTENDLNGAIS